MALLKRRSLRSVTAVALQEHDYPALSLRDCDGVKVIPFTTIEPTSMR